MYRPDKTGEDVNGNAQAPSLFGQNALLARSQTHVQFVTKALEQGPDVARCAAVFSSGDDVKEFQRIPLRVRSSV